MKRVLAALCAACLLSLPVQAQPLSVDAKSCLLMEKETGEVLYAENEHAPLEPASVTKVMTLLLVMEAIDSGTLRYEDMVSVSTYAASMGGSQVYLKENEQMSVEDLLKAVCVASGPGRAHRRQRGELCGPHEPAGGGAGNGGHHLSQLHRPPRPGPCDQRL